MSYCSCAPPPPPRRLLLAVAPGHHGNGEVPGSAGQVQTGPSWSSLLDAAALCLIRPVPLSRCCLFPLRQPELISTQQPDRDGGTIIMHIHPRRRTSALSESFQTPDFTSAAYFPATFIPSTRPRWSVDSIESPSARLSDLLVLVCTLALFLVTASRLRGRTDRANTWYLHSAIKYQMNYVLFAQGCKICH